MNDNKSPLLTFSQKVGESGKWMGIILGPDGPEVHGEGLTRLEVVNIITLLNRNYVLRAIQELSMLAEPKENPN